MTLLYSPLFKLPSLESALLQQNEQLERSRRGVSENESNPDLIEQRRHAHALELIHRPRANYYLHRPLW